ncbi:PREDICTED: RNA-binding protein 40 [Dinoponera quadriceps]|uniref:RNA-binding region-containing protein 3 n=1 Tax=Dinoponera quadriceps TaxID=609295 RepID=A0A6P3Y149_DINQU|nr:PREDICTED: RNA-binding protein 40 [Dinoponera quadriceps]
MEFTFKTLAPSSSTSKKWRMVQPVPGRSQAMCQSDRGFASALVGGSGGRMSSGMIPACDTLRILHLPPQLSDDRRNSLLQRYGAIKTRTLRSSGKYTVTFAKFASQQLATEALLRLHQLNVKGQYLSVEYAKKSSPAELSQLEPQHEPSADNDVKAKVTDLQAFRRKLNSWTVNHVFSQPPPPNIRYKYAAPTKNTLLRIAVQLSKEPAFYTQVLHLMNKMNLPPPFEELEEEFPVLREVYNMEKYKNILGGEIIDASYERVQEEEEEEESEIESDGEDNARPVEIIPVKRKLPQPARRLKIPKFVNPARNIATVASTQKALKPEDMFEPVQLGEAKNLKIELKTLDKSLDAASAAQDSTVTVDGGFGLIFPAAKPTEDAKDGEEGAERSRNKFISSEELEANRISANDQRVLPVFKNYHPGKPSNRLYIKNLAKQVEAKDLHYIYQRYVIAGLKDAENEYDLRLMQEGRMKGQAFVTLQNNVQAQMALNETNGYILKDKPMVVHFAKAAKS